mmetsp:Transcript_9443/g.23164  ORF Transcript_9443/g.23164 Transcript_9443/m.23164 type:complete len:168 (-) Transcript_9443:373-876(-)|eukprot:CAMPEP_0179000644 /NCGR_PEP_ID=MMETSP0795-20121207/10812_1 /TAXON_ID=88552 /ORGANISM="Amoebophrya sp., Strain Ameob2" /LENGTH=167 /DNA_ID=CAMNT_0020693715 /DNA_START=305 /DNA_END=808 /DNA_ORIENTATION=-
MAAQPLMQTTQISDPKQVLSAEDVSLGSRILKEHLCLYVGQQCKMILHYCLPNAVRCMSQCEDENPANLIELLPLPQEVQDRYAGQCIDALVRVHGQNHVEILWQDVPPQLVPGVMASDVQRMVWSGIVRTLHAYPDEFNTLSHLDPAATRDRSTLPPSGAAGGAPA